MSNPFQKDVYHEPSEARPPHRPLPPWLAARLLRPDETVAWVRGPRFNPSWERFVTHPLLFVAGLAAAAACVVMGWLLSETWIGTMIAAALVAAGLVFGSVIVLSVACGYFTRLVVTNLRVVILQGHEVARTWGVDDLPRSLLRYRAREDGQRSPTLDLDAVKSMFAGGASDEYADSKAIMAFGKEMDRIRAREKDRP
jgi:hypothetical protein